MTRSKKNKIKSNLLQDDGAQLDESSTQTARVISHHGRQLFAETENLERIKCKIRQNLGDIACGDYVLVQQALDAAGQTKSGEPQSVIVAVKERANLLVKTGFGGAIKPVAANIGQVAIVTAIKPRPNPYLIDRYLTAAENLPEKQSSLSTKLI